LNREDLQVYSWRNASGWCCLEWSCAGIARLRFAMPSRATAAVPGANSRPAGSVKNSEISGVIDAIDAYFSGIPVSFTTALDWTGATEFQRAVWSAAMAVPYGETRTYARIAAQAGAPGGARAAGNALGANPTPVIVPCHRVVKSDGSPGGFSGGVHLKRALLALEQGKGFHVKPPDLSSTSM